MRATFVLLFVVGCNATQTGDLGNLVFDDNESLSAPGNGAFVVGDELSFNASVADSATVFPGSVIAFSSDEGVLQFDPTPGGLSFRGTIVGEGLADLEVVDAVTLEIIDQISLRGAALASIRVGLLEPFSSGESIGESFEALHMLPGDSMVLLSKPVSSEGEELKGQLFGVLQIDPSIATTSGNVTIGETFTLTAEAIGTSELAFVNTLASATPVNVVSPDDATISVVIPEKGATPISQGTIIVDALLADGNNLDGERYNVTELCIVNSANAPCRLDIEPSFTPNASIFAAKLSGRATIVVELIDSDDVVLQTETIEIDVIAQ